MPAGATPAVVLLSGGLDSATTLAVARDAGYACHALSFDYGQRHKFELQAAANVARHLGAAEHRIATIDLRAFGGSALTGDIEVPKDQLLCPTLEERGQGVGGGRREDRASGSPSRSIGTDRSSSSPSSIPVTYVPARNTIFLSFALGYAEVLDATDIFIGVNAIDYSGYPDCRPAFIDAFEKMANLATRIGVEHTASGEPAIRIHAPLIHLTKAEIIQRGIALGVDYSLTHSCYDPDEQGKPCGHCDSCLLRIAGFRKAGMTDPAG